MYLEEKLTENTYIMRRNVQNYRIIIWTKDVVQAEKDYRHGDLALDDIMSLCEYTSDVLGVDHDDDSEFPEEVKQECLAVITGDITEKQVQDWAKEKGYTG